MKTHDIVIAAWFLLFLSVTGMAVLVWGTAERLHIGDKAAALTIGMGALGMLVLSACLAAVIDEVEAKDAD